MGLAEIAALLGISKAAVCGRRRLSGSGRARARFPEPVAQLSCGPVWRRDQILAYVSAFEGCPKQAVAESPQERQRRLATVDRTLMAMKPPLLPGVWE